MLAMSQQFVPALVIGIPEGGALRETDIVCLQQRFSLLIELGGKRIQRYSFLL